MFLKQEYLKSFVGPPSITTTCSKTSQRLFEIVVELGKGMHDAKSQILGAWLSFWSHGIGMPKTLKNMVLRKIRSAIF